MNMITTRTPNVRAHIAAVPDAFNATNYATAAAQDRLREAMARSVPPESRAKAKREPKDAPAANPEQFRDRVNRAAINRQRILALLANGNRSREAVKCELELTKREIETAMDRITRYGFAARVGSAPRLSGGGGASPILAITAAGRAALAEGRA